MTVQKVELADEPKEVCVVFPGILSYGLDVHNLILDIKKDLDLHMCFNPKLKEGSSNIKFASLENSLLDHADQNATHIQELLGESNKGVPLSIIGYSLGGVHATLTAQKLKLLGIDSTVFIIDTPTPELTQQYFNDKASIASSTQDLINIVKYAAELAGHSDLENVSLTSEQLNDIYSTPIEERIDKIAKHFSPPNAPHFELLVSIAKEDIASLLSYKKPSDLPKLDRIVTLVTDENSKKYKSETGGWEHYAKQVTTLKDTELTTCHHRDLLNEANAPKLAKLIYSEIFKESLGIDAKDDQSSIIDQAAESFNQLSKVIEGMTVKLPNAKIFRKLQQQIEDYQESVNAVQSSMLSAHVITSSDEDSQGEELLSSGQQSPSGSYEEEAMQDDAKTDLKRKRQLSSEEDKSTSPNSSRIEKSPSQDDEDEVTALLGRSTSSISSDEMSFEDDEDNELSSNTPDANPKSDKHRDFLSGVNVKTQQRFLLQGAKSDTQPKPTNASSTSFQLRKSI